MNRTAAPRNGLVVLLSVIVGALTGWRFESVLVGLVVAVLFGLAFAFRLSRTRT